LTVSGKERRGPGVRPNVTIRPLAVRPFVTAAAPWDPEARPGKRAQRQAERD